MTTFTLTSDDDRFTGGAAADVFQGYGGGTDTLKGGAGNDAFYFQYGQQGLVDGGTGTDSITLSGHNNHTLSSQLKIVSIENIYLSESNFYASVAQINAFSKIIPLYTDRHSEFTINIDDGGKVNFEQSYTSNPRLNVDAYDALKAVDITGSRKSDVIDGSDFNDKLNGSLGSDILTGEGGKDSFIFSTKLVNGGIDHITDFSHGQDKIALDDAIFAGVTSSNLKTVFHDITSSAERPGDRLLYDHDTGFLSYDADGNGTQAAVHFATLDPAFQGGSHPTLTWQDFQVV